MNITTITYNIKLDVNHDSSIKLKELLEAERSVFNQVSHIIFYDPTISRKDLHNKCYYTIKAANPTFKSQIIIKGENGCLAAYRSINSNKQKLKNPAIKKKLSLRLDLRLCNIKNNILRVTTLGKRISIPLILYDKAKELFNKYEFGDPLLFERNGEFFLSIPFNISTPEIHSTFVLGVDLGYRRLAATSEGNLFIDKKFNKEKRKLRYLKRCLQNKSDTGSKSAKKHLKKLKRKEYNKNKNFNHHLANAILNSTKANTIVLENLNVKKLKENKHKGKSRSCKSQIGLGSIISILKYKAALVGKQVVSVNPVFTSQTDCLTHHRDGKRQGCRYYANSGLVYDADINAAINIGRKTKLPVSCGSVLDGQATVNSPIETKVNKIT